MWTFKLQPGRDRRIRAGHAWVFSNELDGSPAAIEPGAAVQIVDAGGRFVGLGYANPHSLIAARVLCREPGADIDQAAFWAERIQRAAALRAQVLPGRRSLRLVCGEADDLPGLVIDRYEDVLAVQIGTMGLEVRLPILEEALRSTLAPRGAVLRNQSATRSLEGLERYSRLWFGEVPEQVPFEEAGVSYVADVLNGQKTGFFFDQAHNRAFAAPACAGLDVLDVYANTGAWGLAALKAGARSAVAIESNPATCALIEENGRRNGLSTALQVRCADAREEMAALHRAGRRYGAVFLDPPAFAKNRKSAGAALRAYREVNELAIGLVARGGLLFTSSCSHHIEEERFLGEVLEAAARRQRSPRILRRGEQAPDHPVHPAMPETRYLKHYALSLP